MSPSGELPPQDDRSLRVDAGPAPSSAANLADARDFARLLGPALADVIDSAGKGPGGDEPPVRVVDVGANPLDEHAQYQLLLDAGLCRVTGFEPQQDALAELRTTAGPHETYLPYIIGNGEPGSLRLCASPGFTSLLEPDPAQLALLVDFPRLADVIAREPVVTRRLDDIDEIGRIDLLKIDIQGGELAALRHARSALSDAVAVQTEVGFHRLYTDQPTFAEVDQELRTQGFVPHRFVSTRTWPMAPLQWADPLEESGRQLVEADLLYLRDLAGTPNMSDAALARLALVSDIVYRSVGPALRCVRELIDRGVLNSSVERDYRRMAGSRLVPGPSTIR